MSTTTSYDLDRRVTLVSRPDGDFITPQYDATTGRLQTLTTASGVTTFGYKTTTGQLQSIAAPGETLTYGYDGALLTDLTWTGAVSGTLHRIYDTSFRVASETVAGTTINYTYDADDLLIKAGDMNIPRDAATGFVGSGTTLGTLQEFNIYDAYGALQTYTVKKADGTLIYSLDYGTRDQLGRIVHKTETIQTETHTYDYGYDQNGRLIDVFNDGVAPGSTAWAAAEGYPAGVRVSRNGVEYLALSDVAAGVQPELAPAIWQVTHAYAYDANGNRTMAPNLIGKPAPVYDAQDRMLSYGDCSYAYKNDGSLRSKTCSDGVTTYDYDAFGNLRHVGLPTGNAIDYAIDGQNRRVGKTVTASTGAIASKEGFVYRSQLQPAAWLNSDGSTKAVFVYGLKPNVPEYMIMAGVEYRLVTDQLGSVRVVLDGNGFPAERIDYDEFGHVTSDTAPGMQPYGFAGGHYDTLTSLNHFGSRDYDAVSARWTSKDLFRFDGSRNFYEYADADAINAQDVTGFEYTFSPNNGDAERAWIADLECNSLIGADVKDMGDFFGQPEIIFLPVTKPIPNSAGAQAVALNGNPATSSTWVLQYNSAQLASNNATPQQAIAHELGHIYGRQYGRGTSNLLAVYFEQAAGSNRGWLHDQPLRGPLHPANSCGCQGR
jgi:RHS repeat-associated protein